MKLTKVTQETTHRKRQGNKVEGTWVTDSLGEAPYLEQSTLFDFTVRWLSKCTHFRLFVTAAIITLYNYLTLPHILKFQLIEAFQNAVDLKP